MQRGRLLPRLLNGLRLLLRTLPVGPTGEISDMLGNIGLENSGKSTSESAAGGKEDVSVEDVQMGGTE
jgi:hypothetical protein